MERLAAYSEIKLSCTMYYIYIFKCVILRIPFHKKLWPNQLNNLLNISNHAYKPVYMDRCTRNC